MRKILLIDADSTIPNLALMKLSAWHKSRGDLVKLLKLDIPFHISKAKKEYVINGAGYDRVYCSVIFNENHAFVKVKNCKAVSYGGTGYNLVDVLDEEIERGLPDYSLYDGWFTNDKSYGFITRGCIRNCSFCKVPKKEGKIRQVQTVENIVRHKIVLFMDNNFFAWDKHKEELARINRMAKDGRWVFSFNQGLDIRLLDSENTVLLWDGIKQWYNQSITFAFDNISYQGMIEKKLELLKWTNRHPQDLQFFVYVSPEMKISDTIRRVQFLRKRMHKAYVMLDARMYQHEHARFFQIFKKWCNHGIAYFRTGGFKAMALEKSDSAYLMKIWNENQ